MPRVLITGGTGVLGREVAPRLAQAGYSVRVVSRRGAPAEGAPTEWAQAQIETGEGLAEAVAGVGVIVHCASSPFRRTREVDVEGTRRLLGAAGRAGVALRVYLHRRHRPDTAALLQGQAGGGAAHRRERGAVLHPAGASVPYAGRPDPPQPAPPAHRVLS